MTRIQRPAGYRQTNSQVFRSQSIQMLMFFNCVTTCTKLSVEDMPLVEDNNEPDEIQWLI